MRIELQIKIEDPRFLNLRVDGEVWKVVHKASFQRRLSPLFACDSLERLQEAFAQLECKVAKLIALRLLAKRDYFVEELKRCLKEKRLSDEAVNGALETCRKSGYLEDWRLVERYVISLRQKGKGPRYIAQKLKEKLGYLPQLPHNPEEEGSEIAALLNKRFPRMSGEKERVRVVRFLLSRGFDLGAILKELGKDESGKTNRDF